jgi:ribosome-associated translation inhibitor RaiA
MTHKRNIANSIRELAGEAHYDTMLCEVVSIDDEKTCTVKTVLSGVEYPNVKLSANIMQDKGVYVTPAVGSYVLVTLVDKLNGFISMYSDVDTINAKIDTSVNFRVNDKYIIKIEDGILTIENDSYSLRKAFDDFIAAIEKMTVTTGVGPSGTPVNIAEFKAIAQKLDNFLK